METLLIIDFGSQYNQLIARRVREAKVFCEIVPPGSPIAEILAKNVKGIILSGGPASIYAPRAPQFNPELLRLGVPILGICYGMQAITHHLRGTVRKARFREYGRAELRIQQYAGPLFSGVWQRWARLVGHRQ